MIGAAMLAKNWRALAALAIAAVLAGLILYYRGEASIAEAAAARAQRDLEICRGERDALRGSLARQNAAVEGMEAKAAEAARRGAQARAEAAGAVDAAVRSAEALARRMREPAGTTCPAGEGLAIVREDWRRAAP